ncbi:MAG: amino acid permease [Planctomycetota bacterium]|nr:amino acid permease [Planctomycetota bacterium]
MAQESSKTESGAAPTTQLSRDLRCFDVTMIGVGAMIGAGIFVLTGIAAGTAGPALILAFCLNGIVTIFTAMVYAELGSAIPEAGGGYLWVKQGLPGANAFISGWMSWFAHSVAGSLYALGFGAYFNLVLHGFDVSFFGLSEVVTHKLLGVAVALLFIYINYRGASEAGLIGNIATVAKVIVIGIFIGSGLIAIAKNPDYLTKFTPYAPEGLKGVFMAMGLTFIAFEGYEIIAQAGEEVKDPKRNVPRAIFWSLAIVLPIYILVAVVALGAVNPEGGQPTWQWLGEMEELGLAEAARQFMPFGTLLLLIGGLLSTMSALNATTFSSTRVSFALGRDRNLPDAFGKIDSKTHTPVVALLGSGAIIIVMAVAVPIHHVAAAADIMFLLLFLQVNVAIMTIRKKYGDKLDYGYVIPFFPLVPILGIVSNLGLAVFMFFYSPLAWGIVLGWLACGMAIYHLYAKGREREKVVTPVVLGELLPREKKRFRILVPVANPATAEGLLSVAARLARVEEGEVIVLHTVYVPFQTPLKNGRHLIEKGRPVIDLATSYLRRRGIPASALVRMTHARAWRPIVDTVEEYEIDFLVMGWRGQSRNPRTIVGRNLDEVIRRANCDVAVIQNPFQEFVKTVLVPIALPRQGERMIQVARMLTTRRGGKIDLLHICRPGRREEPGTEQVMKALEKLVEEATAGESGGPKISLECVEARNPVLEISRRAEGYGVVVLGSPQETWIRRKIFGTRPQRIAAKVECPVVLVSRRTGALKFGIQNFFEFFREVEEPTEMQEPAGNKKKSDKKKGKS